MITFMWNNWENGYLQFLQEVLCKLIMRFLITFYWKCASRAEYNTMDTSWQSMLRNFKTYFELINIWAENIYLESSPRDNIVILEA